MLGCLAWRAWLWKGMCPRSPCDGQSPPARDPQACGAGHAGRCARDGGSRPAGRDLRRDCFRYRRPAHGLHALPRWRAGLCPSPPAASGRCSRHTVGRPADPEVAPHRLGRHVDVRQRVVVESVTKARLSVSRTTTPCAPRPASTVATTARPLAARHDMPRGADQRRSLRQCAVRRPASVPASPGGRRRAHGPRHAGRQRTVDARQRRHARNTA